MLSLQGSMLVVIKYFKGRYILHYYCTTLPVESWLAIELHCRSHNVCTVSFCIGWAALSLLFLEMCVRNSHLPQTRHTCFVCRLCVACLFYCCAIDWCMSASFLHLYVCNWLTECMSCNLSLCVCVNCIDQLYCSTFLFQTPKGCS